MTRSKVFTDETGLPLRIVRRGGAWAEVVLATGRTDLRTWALMAGFHTAACACAECRPLHAAIDRGVGLSFPPDTRPTSAPTLRWARLSECHLPPERDSLAEAARVLVPGARVELDDGPGEAPRLPADYGHHALCPMVAPSPWALLWTACECADLRALEEQRALTDPSHAPCYRSGMIDPRDVIINALLRVGAPYKFGAELRNGSPWLAPVDCSELIERACAEAGVSPRVPDGSWFQYQAGQPVDVDRALSTPGALVFRFRGDPTGPKRPAGAHVALVVLPGLVVEASSTAERVRVATARAKDWTHAALIRGVAYPVD